MKIPKITDAQREAAEDEAYAKTVQAQAIVDRFKLVRICIGHILRGERPYRFEYQAESHHNGSYYMTHDRVWETSKPQAKEPLEKYTLEEFPEYDIALKLLRKHKKAVASKKKSEFREW